MVQEQSLPEPRPLEDLLLCTAKAGTPDFIDRNFCFRVISPTSEHLFQALSESEVHLWMSAIKVGDYCIPVPRDFCYKCADHPTIRKGLLRHSNRKIFWLVHQGSCFHT